jgi:putative tryptophan/tyrosine transport system substrate-binding protein
MEAGNGISKRTRRVSCAIALGCALAAPLLHAAPAALAKGEYRVAVVVDVLKPKFQEVVAVFRETLDRQLAASGAKASYSVYDTKTDLKAVPAILEAINSSSPDLVFAVNSPDAFADRNVSLKLSDPSIPVVSENCIPLQSGVAKAWGRPGGSITGVGVFVQMGSLIKMARMINPKASKLIYFSWDRMTEINDWFVTELTAACKKEGIELAEVKYLASAEDEFEFLLQCDRRGEEYFGIEGVSTWVHRDGSYADMTVEASRFVKENIRHFPIFAYDEAGVQYAQPAGTCVIWRDIGAQLAEKGMRVLQGARPGDIPWDYPRKHNILLNLAAAKSIGMTFPQALIDAAYRVYTDYDGNFIGKRE